MNTRREGPKQLGAVATIGVLVPTYGRPHQLEACLQALLDQSRRPDQVVVVARQSDLASRHVIERWCRRATVEVAVRLVDRPGVVQAMRAGLELATCDVVAVTDDDAIPHSDWLERLEPHYRDPHVGGVGGRDLLYTPQGLLEGSADVVGRLSWFGRVTGQHHLGQGPPRSVHVLKGANLSLRRDLWVLDAPLRGQGAQPEWEVDVCLRARRRGWTLVYDPAALVDHHAGPRIVGDERTPLTPQKLREVAFNEAYAVLRWMPWWRRPAAVAYLLLLGRNDLPGVLWSVMQMVRGRPVSRVLLTARTALSGRWSALWLLATVRRRRVREASFPDVS